MNTSRIKQSADGRCTSPTSTLARGAAKPNLVERLQDMHHEVLQLVPMAADNESCLILDLAVLRKLEIQDKTGSENIRPIRELLLESDIECSTL